MIRVELIDELKRNRQSAKNYINELKSKLPEFFNDNDQFDIYTRYSMTYNNVRMEKVYVNY